MLQSPDFHPIRRILLLQTTLFTSTATLFTSTIVGFPPTLPAHASTAHVETTIAQPIGANIVKSYQAFTHPASASTILSKTSFLANTPNELHKAETLAVDVSPATLTDNAVLTDTAVTTQLLSDASLMPEDVESLRKRLLIAPLVELRPPAYSPGSTAGGPSGFGAGFGDAFVGVSGSNRRPRAAEADGAVSMGFGLGDAQKEIGIEVNVSFGSIRRFASNGDVGLKLHSRLSQDSSIAVGWDSGIRWGNENKTADSTVYGVASQVFELKPNDDNNKMPLTLSVGIGGGRFRSFSDIQNQRNTIGLFGSIGLQVAPQASIVSTWTGQDLNLGISLVPIKTQPFFVTALAANVLGRDQASTVYTVSLGYGFNYAPRAGSK
jgi:hypothetical protein